MIKNTYGYNFGPIIYKEEPKKATYKRVEKEEVNAYGNKERNTKKY